MGRTYGRPFYFNYCTSNLDGLTPPSGANSANAPGTSFSTAGTADTDGSVVQLLPGLSHDVHRIILCPGGVSINGGIGSALGDFLVDPGAGAGGAGSSWTSIIDDIICGHTPVPSAAVGLIQCRYEFRLYLKAGTALGWRAKCHNASSITDGRVIVVCQGEPNDPRQWWCGQRVETLGNGANSNGVAITPGNTGAFGSWTSVGGSTSFDYGSIVMGAQGDASAALNATGFQFQVGFSSTKLPGSHDMYMATTTSETAARAGGGLGEAISCHIKAGTQMQVRATQTAAAAVAPGVCLYGVG